MRRGEGKPQLDKTNKTRRGVGWRRKYNMRKEKKRGEDKRGTWSTVDILTSEADKPS